MDLEKDMLNKELVRLEASGDKAGVEKLREDAELMGHGDVVEKANAIIAQLTKLAEEVAPPAETKQALVEELGGTVEELEAREKSVVEEIETVEQTAEDQIEAKVEAEEGVSEQPVENTDSAVQENTEVNQSVDSGKIEGTEDVRLKKYDALKEEYNKYQRESGITEYNNVEIANSLKGIEQDAEKTNKIFEKLPKSVIEDLMNSNDAGVDTYAVKMAYQNWISKAGNKIASMSKDRTNYFDKSNKTEAKVLGTMPNNSEEYIATVANAARFVPKNISEKFVADAVDTYLDPNKIYMSGDKEYVQNGQGSLISGGNKKFDVLRNLVEAGYKEEVKNLLIKSIQKHSPDKGQASTANMLFDIERSGLLTSEEVQELFMSSGVLDEPKEEKPNNEGWGDL